MGNDMNSNEITETTETTETNLSVDTETKGVSLIMDEAPIGFDDDDSEDVIIPRVKIIQTLSPERKDKLADEGDIINNLTLEKLNGKNFIPVFKFNNHIKWIDRADGGGIACKAANGKVGIDTAGNSTLCKACRKCDFDNTKQGRDAVPTCTKYINFFGFFEGVHAPLILSFSRTNLGEGRRMYSTAKVTMQNMFNYMYTLEAKLMSKNKNEWYNITTSVAGASSDADRAFAAHLYKMYSNVDLTASMQDEDNTATSSATPKEDVQSEF